MHKWQRRMKRAANMKSFADKNIHSLNNAQVGHMQVFETDFYMCLFLHAYFSTAIFFAVTIHSVQSERKLDL